MKGRHTVRPSGAHKLLTILMYGRFPYMWTEETGVTKISSVSKLARVLGTESKKVRKWLEYLETSSYLDFLLISENRKQALLKIRKPPNV